jgi:hypothetical protein
MMTTANDTPNAAFITLFCSIFLSPFFLLFYYFYDFDYNHQHGQSCKYIYTDVDPLHPIGEKVKRFGQTAYRYPRHDH